MYLRAFQQYPQLPPAVGYSIRQKGKKNTAIRCSTAELLTRLEGNPNPSSANRDLNSGPPEHCVAERGGEFVIYKVIIFDLLGWDTNNHTVVEKKKYAYSTRIVLASMHMTQLDLSTSRGNSWYG